MLPAGTMLIRSRLLGQVDGVLHAFTTRRHGVSHPPYDSLNMGLHVGDDPNAVIENRRRAVAALGFTLDAWVSGEQVHGTRIIRVTADDKGKGALRHDDAVRGVDGLVTDAAGVLLAGYFADCVPVFVVDPQGPRVGLAHAGWRGTLGNVVGNLLAALAGAYGTDPAGVWVWIGPAIGPCCFQVGPDVADRFRAAGLEACVIGGEKPSVDLPAANRQLLIAAGVPGNRIEVSGDCTACRTDRYFSHRVLGPRTGRMAALLGIAADRQDSAP